MACLVPWIREEYPEFTDRTSGKHRLQNLGRIGFHHPNVGQATAVDLDDGVGQPRRVNLNGQKVLVRILFGSMDYGIAQTRADLDDQRSFAPKDGLGIKGVIGVHRSVRDMTWNLDGPPLAVLLPRGLPPALQTGAAAHETDRPATVGSKGSLAAGRYWSRGIWGFTHPFQNTLVPAGRWLAQTRLNPCSGVKTG